MCTVNDDVVNVDDDVAYFFSLFLFGPRRPPIPAPPWVMGPGGSSSR